MHPFTGEIYEDKTPEELKAIERRIEQQRIPLIKEQVPALKAKTKSERIAFAKKVAKRRARRKANKRR